MINYAVIGTGGVGGYLGIKLADAGYPVHFLLHSDFDHVKKHGLKLDSYRKNIHLSNVNAYQHASDMPKCDVLLVCMKTTQNHLLPSLLKDASKSDSLALVLQNGIGMEEEIAQALPGLKVAGGPIYICSHKIGPGHIQHLDIGTVSLGAFTEGTNDMLNKVAEDFTQSDVKTNVAKDLMTLRWKKLVWNVPFNGLSVALNTTTDKIVGDESTCKLAKKIMLEIILAGNANGCNIEESFANTMIELTKKMIPYAPSMKVDYDNRRELEIEYIYSRPLLLGQKTGIEMPETSQLERQLRQMDNQNRKQ